jgi:S1-C subfamily serine protease
MALLPPGFLDCVVAIGVETHKHTYQWIATGFLVARPSAEDPSRSHVFFVTNKHVFEDESRDYHLDSGVIGFNPAQGTSNLKTYACPLREGKQKLWTGSEKEDVAVMLIDPEPLQKDERLFKAFHISEDLVTIDQMNDLGFSEGDFVYILGYPMPMRLVDPDRHYAVVRSGSIARIRDTLARLKTDFLVDAFVFPGNSGGPVVNKLDFTHIEGTKPITKAYGIGIVKAYEPYQDIAISEMTGKRRVVFEENSGLARVIPSEFIIETVEAHVKRLPIPDQKDAEIGKNS